MVASSSVLNTSRQGQDLATPLDKTWLYLTRIVILSIVLLVDLTLNATSEYEHFNYNNKYNESSNASYLKRDQIHKVHILLCSLQLLSQMSSFIILFSLLCDTFPFQIGLIGVLLKRFKSVLYLYGAYIVMTLVLSCVRLVSLVL